jgi:hypothetical protein
MTRSANVSTSSLITMSWSASGQAGRDRAAAPPGRPSAAGNGEAT